VALIADYERHDDYVGSAGLVRRLPSSAHDGPERFPCRQPTADPASALRNLPVYETTSCVMATVVATAVEGTVGQPRT
jgi:hypothetical protein